MRSRSTSQFPSLSPTSASRRLRDISNIEEYVLAAVQRAAPAAGGHHRALLQAHGVNAVRRVERALPPGVPLMPVLETVLPARLAAVEDGLAHAVHPVAAVA